MPQGENQYSAQGIEVIIHRFFFVKINFASKYQGKFNKLFKGFYKNLFWISRLGEKVWVVEGDSPVYSWTVLNNIISSKMISKTHDSLNNNKPNS